MTKPSTNQVVFLRLRNRTLNRFKTIKKTTSQIKKVETMKAKPSRAAIIKRTLRVFPQIQIRTIKAPTSYLKSIPAKYVSRTTSALIGHRRVFLRNRRLMALSAHQQVACY